MASVTIRPVRIAPRAEALRQGPVRAAPRPPAVGAAADLRADGVPRPREEPVVRARRGRALHRRARRRAGRPHQRPGRQPLGRVPGRQRRDVRLLRDQRGPARWRRRCSTPPTEWAAGKGRERILGPMDFTTNDEIGILIEGFERRPMILEPWHPPYYRAADRGRGLRARRWTCRCGNCSSANSRRGRAFDPSIHAAAKKALDDEGIVIRNMRKRDMAGEVRRFMDVYNEAWGDNWGFVPITDAEVEFQAKNLKQVIDENWAYMAEKDGEVVGAALTLPDINQVMAKLNGRLLPFGWAQVPARQTQDRPAARLRARGQARLPPHRRRRRALPAPPRGGGGAGRHRRRRDGLDPRDERADEPGDGGDGGQSRQEVPALREGFVGMPGGTRLRELREAWRVPPGIPINPPGAPINVRTLR